MNDLGRARRLLEDHRPAPGEVDLRGWEWRYLWQECRSDALGELHHYPPSAHSLAYSPDGKMLAVAGYVREFVEIWDVTGPRRIKTLLPNEGHLVAFSPRGDLLAAGVGNQIRLWRTGTWNPIGQLALPGGVNVFKFSPDGSRLASLSEPNDITVWDVDQQKPLLTVDGPTCYSVDGDAHHGALDFAPDGKALVVGGSNDRLQVVDLASGKMIFEIAGEHGEAVLSVAWSPDGSVIASGSGYNGGPIRLWEAASGKPAGMLEGHTSSLYELIFSADGRRLYSASGDQTIRIWDVGQRQCLATLRGSSDIIEGLTLSPDGNTLASAGKDGTVAVWSTDPHAEKEQPRVIPLVNSWPAWALSGPVLAVARQGAVRVLDVITSEEIERIPELGNDVRNVGCSPEGTFLVSRCRNRMIRVWSWTERRLVHEWEDANDLYFLRFQADGRRLVSFSTQGKAIYRDTRTWQVVRTFTVAAESLAGPIFARVVSPDGGLLAFGTRTGAVRWFSGETGELLATTTTIHRYPVVDIAFSVDSTRAATVAEDGTVAIWDPSSFQLIDAFKGHMGGAHGVAFSPDGRRLATGGGVSRDAVMLWDLSTRHELLVLAGQGSVFHSVAISQDGRRVFAGGSQGTLSVWDTGSLQSVGTFRGHREAMKGLAILSGSDTVVSVDSGALRLWHAPSFAEIEAAEKSLKSGQSP